MKKYLVVLLLATLTTANAQEKNLTIAIKGGTIDAALLPSNTKNKLAIIIAGSGPTDKNGNNNMGMITNSYKMLAEALATTNIATLRYDKRGIGKSKLLKNNEANMSFDDLVQDAVTLYQYAKDSLGYNSIYFIGHSEGSLVGMLAAIQTNSAGFISISGAGRSIDEVIKEQLKTQPQDIQAEAAEIFSSLKNGKTVEDVPQYLMTLFRPSVQPYMISWIKYNPTIEIKKLHCPVLIMNGTCDIQVPVTEANLLKQAKPNATLSIINNMTHVLKETDIEDCANKGTKTYYNSNLPISKELTNSIIQFINQ